MLDEEDTHSFEFLPWCYYQRDGSSWEFIIMDPNHDGSKELFVRLGNKAATAVLHYEEG